VLSIKGFGFQYEGDDKYIIDNINWEIGPGEVGLLMGPTGSGKSTLLYAVSGFTGKYVDGRAHGSIAVNGLDPSRALREGIVYYVPQEPTNSFVGYDVMTELVWRGAGREDAVSIARELGIDHLLNRHVFRLSGGEAQKVAIAAAFLGGYRVLLFDGPLSNLDSASRRDFVNILHGLKDRGVTAVVAEHRRGYLEGIADTTLELNARSRASLPSLKMQKIKHLSTVLKIENLNFSYDGIRPVLRDINLDVNGGEAVGLIGENGSGKSTLLKIITGMIKAKGIRRNFKTVGFSMQTPEIQFLEDTVEKEIKYSKTGESYSKIVRFLGLEDKLNQLPHSLSRGQRVRVAVASAASMEPDLMILDEPTEGQDPEGVRMMGNLARAVADSGAGVIVITQEPEFASAYCDRVIKIGGA